MMELVIGLIYAFFGSVFGSFANVCIWRLPRGESVVWPASRCVHCQGQLRPWQLVPIFSWLFLGGKCAYCQGEIHWRYPVVELVTAVLFGLIGYFFGFSLQAFRYLILLFALVVSVGTDFSHREIPDEISWGSSAVLFVLALVTLDWPLLIGGAVLFGLLYLIAFASGGGMGGGDIKLSLAIGLALGWRLGLVGLFVAFLVGGLLAMGLLFSRKAGGKHQVPFAPFLALGAVTAIFFGDLIIRGYWDISMQIWRW
jgi:prepilin signal peptidase PulO-like enzyme (type II secretory pathway)